MSGQTLVAEGAALSLGMAPFDYSVAALANGDLYVAWSVSSSGGYAYQLFGQEFTSSGSAVGARQDLSNGYAGADAYGRPVSGFAVPAVAALPDGHIALTFNQDSGVGEQYGSGTEFYLLGAAGSPYLTRTLSSDSVANRLVALGDSDSLVIYQPSAAGSHVVVQAYTPSGAAIAASANTSLTSLPAAAAAVGASGFVIGQGTTIDYFDGVSYRSPATTAYAVTGAAQLSNGQVILAESPGGDSASIYVQAFDPATDTVGAARLIYTGAPAGVGAQVLATPDGGYVLDWGDDYWGSGAGLYVSASGQVGPAFSTIGLLQETPSGQLFATSSNQGANLAVQFYALQAGSSGTEAFQAAQPSSPGWSTAGWTSAAVLANGDLALTVVQNHQATVQIYDAASHGVATVGLAGYGWSGAGAPTITDLPVGGFYEVGYAGSANYEIYNANNQAVFFHNQWSSPTGAFTPLANGGYVTTDSAANTFGLFDAHNNNIGWLSLPSNAAGTPMVHALAGGGFVFTYAGSSAFDAYDASGNLLGQGVLGASASTMATGLGALSNGGFVEAWLSADGGRQGLPTTLELQAFDASGHAVTSALQVTQDLDPWHTAFQVQAHADGSAALLWSQGGGVFVAEYADDAVGPASAALAGQLSTTVAIELKGDAIGFAWFQNGHAWAEVMDPSTGAAHAADLGAASSLDLSSLHALATDHGGLAVSWRGASGVQGAVLDPDGHLGPLAGLQGDLLGVNSAGQAVAVHGDAGFPAQVQPYILNDGLFWTH